MRASTGLVLRLVGAAMSVLGRGTMAFAWELAVLLSSSDMMINLRDVSNVALMATGGGAPIAIFSSIAVDVFDV